MQEVKYFQNLKRIYARNMAALKKRYPELAAAVENVTDTGSYRIQPTNKENVFNLYITAKNMFYYDEKENLYHVKKELDSLNLKNTRLALSLGFGLGYEVIYYMQALAESQRTAHIFVIEKDLELFCMSLYTTDIVPIIENENVVLFIGLDEHELFIEFNEYLNDTQYLKYIKAINPVYYSSAIILNKDYYLQAIKTLKEASVRAYALVGNSPDDSLVGLRNMFANIDYIVKNPGINLLYDKFKNKPAVVVSSGPSLDKNVHLLKGIEDKVLIICAESTYGILMNKGIKPNIVCTLERPERNNYYWNDFDPQEVESVFLASCPVIPRKLNESHKGKYLIVYRKFDHFKWLELDKGMLNIAQSSGNMAFSIAAALGCDPIMLLGQDLAFDKEKELTHAEGYWNGTNDERYHQQELIEIKGNDGKTILTSRTWYEFLKSYEIEVARYKGKCINCTEGGAYIEGTQVMPFHEAIEKYLNDNIYPLDIIKNSIKGFTDSQAQSDMAFLIPKIDDAIKDINLISDYCHKGIELIEAYQEELETYGQMKSLQSKQKKRVKKIYEDIIKLKMESQKFSATFQLLIMHVVQSYYMKFEIDMNELPSHYDSYEVALAHISLRQKDWFTIINNLSLLVRKELENARDILKKMV